MQAGYINAILYVTRTGCLGRMLACDLPAWQRVVEPFMGQSPVSSTMSSARRQTRAPTQNQKNDLSMLGSFEVVIERDCHAGDPVRRPWGSAPACGRGLTPRGHFYLGEQGDISILG
jgi:hypothetical protein